MSYKFDSIVTKSEASALKEMIFKRAQERAQVLNENTQEDVMDMARESFVSKDNPFSKIVENSYAATAEKTTEVEKNDAPQDTMPKEDIGFPVAKELKLQNSKNINNQIAASAVRNNMAEAREALSNKKSFMGALNFLNSQAAISLMRTRADKFEVVV